jgi:hypothetical protein
VGEFRGQCEGNNSWSLHSGTYSSVSIVGCGTPGGLALDIRGLGDGSDIFGLKDSVNVS